MSETSQGPGWWEASDARWYPPEEDLMAAPNWHQGELGEWLPPTGAKGGAPGWWVSANGDWYPPDRHPMPCSRAEMPKNATQLRAPEHTTTDAQGAESDAHSASRDNCSNGHPIKELDNFCTVCGSQRSKGNVEQVSSPREEVPFVPIGNPSNRNAAKVMSNTSQGPGWWLASDGRWYPPESHPYHRPPPPPPPGQWPPSNGGGVSNGPPSVNHAVGWIGSRKLTNAAPWTFIAVGVLLALGSFLPWATAATSFGTFTEYGMSSGGAVTLICAALVATVGILLLRGTVTEGWLIGAGVALLIALAVSLYKVNSFHYMLYYSPTSQPVGEYDPLSAGAGLTLCVIVSSLGLIAAVFIFINHRKAAKRPAQSRDTTL